MRRKVRTKPREAMGKRSALAQLVARMYRDKLSVYEHMYPAEYSKLVQSRSMDSDHLVRPVVLSDMDDCSKHARLFAVAEWDAAMNHAWLKRQTNNPLRALCSAQAVVHALSSPDFMRKEGVTTWPREPATAERSLTAGLLVRISDLKEAFLARKRLQSPKLCAVLTCAEKGTFTLNSRPWCDKHKGVALLNAMRHTPDCAACPYVGILALKGAIDSGHLKALHWHLTPLVQNAYSGPSHLSRRFFCSGDGCLDLLRGSDAVLDFVYTLRRPKWEYTTTSGQTLRVPQGSLVLADPDSRNPDAPVRRAAAWIQLMPTSEHSFTDPTTGERVRTLAHTPFWSKAAALDALHQFHAELRQKFVPKDTAGGRASNVLEYTPEQMGEPELAALLNANRRMM